jgi:hypothetical protein
VVVNRCASGEGGAQQVCVDQQSADDLPGGDADRQDHRVGADRAGRLSPAKLAWMIDRTCGVISAAAAP